MAAFTPPEAPDFSRWHLPYPLADFQQEAVREALQRRHGTILLPTGSGKTVTAIALLLQLRRPTVILVPTKVLIDQWSRELAAAGIRAGVWYGEEKREGFVTLTTYQSLYQDPGLVAEFPVLLMDEGDLTTGDVWSRILVAAKTHEYAIILTATLPDDPNRRSDLETDFPVLIRRTAKQMISAGRFVPVDIIPDPVRLGPVAQRQYEDIETRLRNLRRVLGTGIPMRVIQLTRAGSADVRRSAYAYLKLLGARQEILARVPERASALLSIVQQHPAQRILVFGTRVDALADAAAYLTVNGHAARILSGETLPDERRFILNEWGRAFFVLCSVDVLTRGYNVPSVSIAVIMGGGTGERRIVQRIGRIVRPAPGKERAIVYVIYAEGTTEDRLPPAVRRIFAGEVTQERGESE